MALRRVNKDAQDGWALKRCLSIESIFLNVNRKFFGSSRIAWYVIAATGSIRLSQQISTRKYFNSILDFIFIIIKVFSTLATL